MKQLTRVEAKEKIYMFLKKQMNDSIPERQVQANLQYHYIESFANEYEPANLKINKRIFLEVFNEIVLLGIVARERNEQFFFITSKGEKWLEDQTFDLHDPELYLKNLPPLDTITLNYITESIHSFNYNLFLSTTITLGVASENLILELARCLEQKTQNPNLKKYLKSKNSQMNKIIQEINKICEKNKDLHYAHYKLAIDSLAHFLRLTRNEYAHPNNFKPQYDDTHALLTIFKKYAKMIIELQNKIQETKF
ncbi:MAG: hypothetical protein ABIF40_03685 [archaeon]